MNVVLTSAELVVMSEEFEIDPVFAIGERDEAELSAMSGEGLRSLLARGLVWIDDDSIRLSAAVADVASAALAPAGLLTYTRLVGDRAEISTVLISDKGLWGAMPIADDVVSYAETDSRGIVDVIAEGEEVPSAGTAVYRVEVLNGHEQRSEGAMTWASGEEGMVAVFDGDEAVAVSIDEIRESLRDLLASVLPTDRTDVTSSAG